MGHAYKFNVRIDADFDDRRIDWRKTATRIAKAARSGSKLRMVSVWMGNASVMITEDGSIHHERGLPSESE